VPVAKVLEEVKGFSEAGFREVILTGIHLGGYGRDLSPQSTVVALLREMDAQALPLRVRVSSLDPDEVTVELVDLLKRGGSICNHMHLALQSGSDNVLKAMHRPYTAKRFREVVELLAREVEDISIGADVIVGFPGESEDDFNETFELIEALPLSYLHVFPYSERSGTEATAISPQVDGRIIKERAKSLRLLGEKKRIEFYGKFIGKEVEVLVESGRAKKTGFLKAVTSNYISVFIDATDALKGRVVSVRLIGDGLSLEGMRGVLL
jgi:threonylcarbamoyladenosine tRNA methylthiotransferase MtaB